MEMLSPHWFQIQEVLFPYLQEKIDPMSSNHERLVAIIELSTVRAFISKIYHGRSGGRPWYDRVEIAIAFLGKHIFNLPTTRALQREKRGGTGQQQPEGQPWRSDDTCSWP